jgi:hypothetical protein
MGFYQFLEEVGVHRFDYSGVMDLDMGLSRMEQVEKIFSSHISGGKPLKVLIDFRNTDWENMQTHDALAKIAREKFSAKSHYTHFYTAIVNNQYDGPSFENEHWFTRKDEALYWLVEMSLEKNADGK